MWGWNCIICFGFNLLAQIVLATKTATAPSVRFILDSITFAPMVAIFLLCDYALILGIQLIHFFMALKLEPLMCHPVDLNLGYVKSVPSTPYLLIYWTA